MGLRAEERTWQEKDWVGNGEGLCSEPKSNQIKSRLCARLQLHCSSSLSGQAHGAGCSCSSIPSPEVSHPGLQLRSCASASIIDCKTSS